MDSSYSRFHRGVWEVTTHVTEDTTFMICQLVAIGFEQDTSQAPIEIITPIMVSER